MVVFLDDLTKLINVKYSKISRSCSSSKARTVVIGANRFTIRSFGFLRL